MAEIIECMSKRERRLMEFLVAAYYRYVASIDPSIGAGSHVDNHISNSTLIDDQQGIVQPTDEWLEDMARHKTFMKSYDPFSLFDISDNSSFVPNRKTIYVDNIHRIEGGAEKTEEENY